MQKVKSGIYKMIIKIGVVTVLVHRNKDLFSEEELDETDI